MNCAARKMPPSRIAWRLWAGGLVLLCLGLGVPDPVVGAELMAAQPPQPSPQAPEAAKTLVIATWGGAYETTQRAALFQPFSAATGIRVRTASYSGGVAALRAHLAEREALPAGEPWDLVDMIRADARTACDEGLLDSIDPDSLAPAPDGVPAREDFLSDALGPCSIGHLVFATVIAYNDRAFPGVKPRQVADFFDTETFPGKRALRRAPVGLLEWALRSYRVPRRQIYDLLSTERGFDLAFRRLEQLRPEIVWWREAADPIVLLKLGAVSMATGFNGRFFHAQVLEGAPISLIWDSQLIEYSNWAIPRGSRHPKLALQFVRFATEAQQMAEVANRIAYGPTRRSAQRRVGLHAVAGVPMEAYMPTAPRHLDVAILKDDLWYAKTEALRRRRFEAWLAQAGATKTSGSDGLTSEPDVTP